MISKTVFYMKMGDL